MLIFWALDLEWMLIWQKIFFMKKCAIFQSINLPFDVQVAEKILNVIYSADPQSKNIAPYECAKVSTYHEIFRISSAEARTI